MKKLGIILLFSAFMPLLNSCQAEESVQVIEFQFTDYQVIYVPPSEDNDNYMNTFIDLKAEYPEEITSPKKTVMDNQDLPSDYTLDSNSMYLLKDEDVIYSSNHNMSYGDFANTLESIVSTDNQIIY